MNSEELEHSLRTEFESYLNNVRAEMRQEVYDFQEKFQTEFEKHKSHLDEIFRDFSARLENEKPIDEPFKESVVEHLRLARDEGARITASAIAEAEEMQMETSAATAAAEATAGYGNLRDAINDITSQDTQSGILKSLVTQAAHFTPRGAFFIIKNEYFVGWRVFGDEGTMDEQRVREIYFPMSAETILGEAVRSLSAVESGFGTFDGDEFYLSKLEFGQPERMFAIPLIARGRGVAVLYADFGAEGGSVNIEALETLVRIAGLTVELLASSQGARISAAPSRTVYQTPKPAPHVVSTPEPAPSETAQTYEATSRFEEHSSTAQYDYSPPQNYYAPANEYAEPQTDTDSRESQMDSDAYEIPDEVADESVQTAVQEDFYSVDADDSETESPESAKMTYSWEQPATDSDEYGETSPASEETPSFEPARETSYSQPDTSYSFNDFSVAPKNDFEYAPDQSFGKNTPQPTFEETTVETETTQFDARRVEEWQPSDFQQPQQFETPRYDSPETYSNQSFEAPSGNVTESYAPAAETVRETATVTAQPVKTRLSERNVDLPIEVAEDERRLHNDARRFARLLVSEIKLYNEQKVKEGRESGDLYERLREAIDRSREMYNKRVQPPVAAKFDYFHYELVSNLAEGDENSLGAGYPGANI
ncbi:MAG TPA: hypothetical protein VF692_05645 [Pyrinomonadaceae bacterium]